MKKNKSIDVLSDWKTTSHMGKRGRGLEKKTLREKMNVFY